MTRSLPSVLVALLLLGCPTKKNPPPPEPPDRCLVDLDALELFSKVGSGASATAITSDDQLIGGQSADGRAGDVLLRNDKIRVIIQQPGRQVSPVPYGGTIIDADRVRPSGTAGHDQFGKLGLIYSFGRTVNVSKVEILEDGAGGGRAVVAATGTDALLDYVNVQKQVTSYVGPGLQLVVNPDQPVDLKITTYYVLSPGESRVRILTAVCNQSHENVFTTIGDIADQGGTTSFFNPSGCTGAFGASGCTIDPAPWFGYQGEDVAYGLRSYRLDSRLTPTAGSALLTVAGVAATVADGESLRGLATWMDPQATQRAGSFGIRAGGQNLYLRDFFVGRDLAEVTSALHTLDGTGPARLAVTVQDPAGQPAASARVAVFAPSTGKLVTLLVTDATGKARADLPTGNYRAQAWVEGHALPAAKDVSLPSAGTVELPLTLGGSRNLALLVREAAGGAIPAKVTVLCPSGACAFQSSAFRPFIATENLPSNVAAVAFVPPDGHLTLKLPPDSYQVVVSRGPEYSIFPDTWPTAGAPLDLTAVDQALEVDLARVVDTTGWMSADLHVHSAGSSDSSIANERRVLNFAAEGVDVLVSTDHDVVVDYAPTIRALGAEGAIASLIGDEVTSFDYGHFNAYPLTREALPNGGAFDWAGGDGPSLRLPQLFGGLREKYPGAIIQLNHPRGFGGALTQLRVDTATGASHANPADFRMEADPTATATNTKLFSEDFDAIEVQNGLQPNRAYLNDWMTFLSRGALRTATAVSDTHALLEVTGGYARTFVKTGTDAPSRFEPAPFAAALKARHAVGTNGPFLTATAQALDGAGAPTGPVVGVGDTLSTPAGSKVRISVDVQAPEWMTFDVLELYTHAAGREAVDGQENTTWPASRILATQSFDVATLPLEVVPNTGALTFRRIHLTHAFEVTPAKDTWYVVMLRSTSAARTLFPLASDGTSCDGATCKANTSRPAAYTNAILVDADGSGAYDDFPLKVSQGLSLPTRPPVDAPRRVPTVEELEQALKAMLRQKH